MEVKLKLFSSLMEYLPAEVDGNTVIVKSSNITCHGLIDRYHIPRESIQVIMLNGDFVPMENRDDGLKNGDIVSIWPAIQGG